MKASNGLMNDNELQECREDNRKCGWHCLVSCFVNPRCLQGFVAVSHAFHVSDPMTSTAIEKPSRARNPAYCTRVEVQIDLKLEH